MKNLTTALLLSIISIDVNAMDDHSPIEISGTGMQLKKNTINAINTLKDRASQGDKNAQRALGEKGETKTAVDFYNQLVSAPPHQQYMPQSGSPGGGYGTPLGSQPRPDYSKMSPEEIARLLTESDARINARINEIEGKYHRGETVSADEEKELEFLRKQLDESLFDRKTYQEYKMGEVENAQKRRLAAEAMRQRNAAKTAEQKEKEAAYLAECEIKYNQVRDIYANLSQDQKDKLALFYRNSKPWQILYQAKDNTDFSMDAGGFGQMYIGAAANENAILRMNQDELHALIYALHKWPEINKRAFWLEKIDTRLKASSIPMESSLETGIRLADASPLRSGSSSGSNSSAASSSGGTPPPPPPPSGSNPPPPPPPPSGNPSQQSQRPIVSDADLQAAMAKLKKTAK